MIGYLTGRQIGCGFLVASQVTRVNRIDTVYISDLGSHPGDHVRSFSCQNLHSQLVSLSKRIPTPIRGEDHGTIVYVYYCVCHQHTVWWRAPATSTVTDGARAADLHTLYIIHQ